MPFTKKKNEPYFLRTKRGIDCIMSDFVDLPKGWERVFIQDVAKINPALPNKDLSNELEIQFVPMKLVEEKVNKIHLIETRQYQDVKKNSYTAFIDRDVLFAKVTPCMENGKVAVAGKLKNGIGFGSSEFHVVRAGRCIVPEFLFFYIVQDKFRNEAAKVMTGAVGLRRVPKQFIESHEIPIPPLAEQHRIVTAIETLFTHLDKGIENLKTAQGQLKVYRQAVLKWAFEGRLTCQDQDLQDFGIKQDLRQSANPINPDKQSSKSSNPANPGPDKGELPKGWEWKKTGEIIKTINNGYTPTREYLSEGSGEIPFLKVYNLNFDGTLNSNKNPTFIPDAIHRKDLKRSICYPGDVLINIVGPPLGKVSIVTSKFPEWNINQAIVLFRPNEHILSKYISYFLQNHVTIQWLENTSKATAGQWNVKVSTCREIPIPYCNVAEQQKIVSEIETRLSVCDKIEETLTASLLQAEALRQSILKKAFEGKLVPQDERDEPAAVLLARIKAERASPITPKKNKSNGKRN